MSLCTPEQQLFLNQLAYHYGIEPSQLHCMTDNPDDGVYGFTRQGQAFVLKYALPTVRTFAALQAQINWGNFLAEHNRVVPMC